MVEHLRASMSLRRNRRRNRATQPRREAERRGYCWDLHGCSEAERSACAAYFRGANCWDIWALKPAKERRCCQRAEDCLSCPIGGMHAVAGLPVYLDVVTPGAEAVGNQRPTLPMCVYLAQVSVPDAALAGLDRFRAALCQMLSADQDDDAFLCRRKNATLSAAYVAAVCVSPDFRRCPIIESGPRP